MSLDLSFGRKWENSKTKLLPEGNAPGSSVSVSDEKLTCTSVVGESAKKTKYINVRAGETIRLTVVARVLSQGDNASIAIDFPSPGNLLTSKTINSTEWQSYEISAVVPVSAVDGDYVSLQIGLFGDDEGTAEFYCPTVGKDYSQLGTTQTLACAQIFFDTTAGNAARINQGFSNHGIYSLLYNSINKELYLNIDKTPRDDPETSPETIPTRPLFFTQMAFDNSGPQVRALVSDYNYLTGDLTIRFYDNSGVLVDITTLLGAGNIFFNFKAEVS